MAVLKKRFTPLIFICLLLLPVTGSAAEKTRLDINSATAEELTSLPYVGEIRAGIIIDCRSDHGPFTDLNELLICDGIGPETLKAMRADLEAIAAINRANSDNSPEVPIKTSEGDIIVLANADYFPALIDKIKGARKSIDMSMFVFRTTDSSKDRPSKIIEELQRVAGWGVKVRVFLENSRFDESLNETNRNTAKKLEEKGIKVIFDSPKTTTHTKVTVIDRRYSFVGSHNFTNSALKYNNELSLLVDDRQLAERISDYLEGIIRE